MDEIYAALGTLVVALISVGLKMLNTYVKTKIQNEQAAKVLDAAERTALSAVQQTAQTLTDDLRKASADGVLTKEEKEKALAHSLQTFERDLGSKGLGELKEMLRNGRGMKEDDMQLFIKGLLEAAVAAHKARGKGGSNVKAAQ